jgi:hypothetical protein
MGMFRRRLRKSFSRRHVRRGGLSRRRSFRRR